MNKDELAMRKAGEKPSQQFLKQKKELWLQERRRGRQAHDLNKQQPQFQSEQDKYLANIEEVNKANKEAGLPTFKAQIKYVNTQPPTSAY